MSESRDETPETRDGEGEADVSVGLEDDTPPEPEADVDTDDEPPGGFDPRDAHAFTITAIGFELLLIPVAWLVLHFWEGPALTPPPLEMTAIVLGVALTVPPVAALCLITWTPIRRLPNLRRIRERVEASFGKTLARLQVWQIAAISVAAGVGEEILFRGVLQPRIGLLLASVLFGLLHWISPTYALLAGVLGAYIGWTLQASENLITPILVHGLYDLVALLIVRRELRRSDVISADL